MIRLFLVIACFVYADCTKEPVSQTTKDIQFIEVVPTPFSKIDGKVDETSGLAVWGDYILTQNDSGGKEEIYLLNHNGKIEKEIKLKDTKNHDWEDLAIDDDFIYVGDFGNNKGKRKNLVVYQFDKELKKNAKNITKYKFNYAAQNEFDFDRNGHEFDCESLISINGELFIFSKDWKNKNTQVYHLPKSDKESSLTPLETYPINAYVTGADYNTNTKTLILSGYINYENFVWVVPNSTPEQFFNDDMIQIHLSRLKNAQVEGISFMNDSTILISSEKTDGFTQQLWTLDVPKTTN